MTKSERPRSSGRGGRGSSGKVSADAAIAKATGGVIMFAQPRTIETVYRRATNPYQSSYYKDKVLEADVDKNGNVVFSYPRGEYNDKTRRSSDVKYTIVAGAVNGSTFNINWDNVQSVSGQTYDIKDEAKRAGLRWDGKNKRWVR